MNLSITKRRARRAPGRLRSFAHLLLLLLILNGGCGEGPPVHRIVDIQELRIHEVDAAARPDRTERAEILVVGGGVAGLAAVISACDTGHSVLWTEETDWLGGQFTSQGMSASDDSYYTETIGSSSRFKAFRMCSARRDGVSSGGTSVPRPTGLVECSPETT